ncbi:MAG: beta-aspartyl-peptidase [Clostridiales bacterium]|uniref:beta-aspartyl-peptidase n=1 Tax=Clostridium sp. N3C TaxID=1776758 RepID=UPI00092E1B43|nr:beta-aspartyl-peptidase [Clostridium sp. N3C]NLZ49883.1 beta-aspartyl-peptidase [Clostridiales bacterium]SCN24160.1 Isoaspartyl dipeptidase [Clostridium sp. N3C]
MKIIKNAEVYAPEYIGKKYVVIAGPLIEGVYDSLDIPEAFPGLEVIDGEGKLMFPGFIDSHVHIIGAGGEGGFNTRTPEIQLSQLISAGITTVVGCLGTDGITRNLKTLLAKAYGLEEDGISAYIFTGSYQLPAVSITGKSSEDIILIEKVIGIGEIALSDNRSSQPSYEEFLKVVAEARVAGLISGKAGVVNLHIGNGREALSYLMKMLKETDIPATQVIPTHINRSKDILNMGVKYTELGGIIDLTTSFDVDHLEDTEVRAAEGLKILLDKGVDISKIQFTSDGQGSLPIFDEKGHFKGLGVGSVKSLYEEVKEAVLKYGVDLEEALKVITSNVADNFKFKKKGRIESEKDADLVLVDKETLEVRDVFAKGKAFMVNGKLLVKGTFEE